MILVAITVADPAAQITSLGSGALLRVERSATESGVYAEFATVALNANVVAYDIWDPSGDEDSWYRTRFSEDDGANPTAYSSSFQAGEQAYATRTDLLLRFRQDVTDTRTLDRMTTVLAEVTRDLTREVGYSFFRQPLSGTEAVVFHGNGSRRLHVHGNAARVGVVSLTSVEIKVSATDDDWTLVPSTDWFLEGEPGGLHVEPGDPYFHVVLATTGTYRTFPRGDQRVRLTGVFGWPAIQPDHRAATVAWAHQRLFAEPGLNGIPAPDDLGPAYAPDRHPRAVYDLLCDERDRHACWT